MAKIAEEATKVVVQQNRLKIMEAANRISAELRLDSGLTLNEIINAATLELDMIEGGHAGSNWPSGTFAIVKVEVMAAELGIQTGYGDTLSLWKAR